MDGSTPMVAAETTAVAPMPDADAAEVAAWVRARPDGSPFHMPAWKRAVERGLGKRATWLVARRGGAVSGVLPLVHQRSRLTGSALISTGFSVGGGVLAEDDAAAHALAAEAIALAERSKVACLELRGETARFEGWPTKDGTYAGFIRDLPGDADERLKAIPRKKRADVRKGIAAENLTTDARADLETFFDLYARNLHALGTPILPKRWYGALKEAFGEDCEIATVSADGTPVVALLSLYHEGTAYPYYVGAAAEARRLHAFDHVYWDLMGRAVDRGATRFDFGRSKVGTGAADYKKHWGFEGRPLAYQYHLLDGAEMPDVNPNNPKFARFVRMWKKLPLAATKVLGPPLARHLA